jgi:tetratricopeptide (TPR) repeat protein
MKKNFDGDKFNDLKVFSDEIKASQPVDIAGKKSTPFSDPLQTVKHDKLTGQVIPAAGRVESPTAKATDCGSDDGGKSQQATRIFFTASMKRSAMRAALLSVLCPLVIFATGAYGAPDSRLAPAVESFNKGMYREALDSAKEYLKSVPNSRLALEMAAKSSVNLKRYQEGADYAGRLFTVDKRPESLYLQASILFSGNKCKDALSVISNLLKMDPNYGPAYLLKAEIVRRQEGIGASYRKLIEKAEGCHFDDDDFKSNLKNARSLLPKKS